VSESTEEQKQAAKKFPERLLLSDRRRSRKVRIRELVGFKFSFLPLLAPCPFLSL